MIGDQWRPTGTATGPLGRLVSPSAMAPKLGVGPSLPSHQMGPALTPLSHKSAATCARIAGLSGCHSHLSWEMKIECVENPWAHMECNVQTSSPNNHINDIKGATPPAADPWSRGLERKKKGLVVTCSCVGNVCVYFSSDPAMSEADLHVLSGALAFGGTETLGAGAFRGISRSALEVAGLEREEENNNSSSSNNKKNNNNNHKPKRKPNPKLQQEEKINNNKNNKQQQQEKEEEQQRQEQEQEQEQQQQQQQPQQQQRQPQQRQAQAQAHRQQPQGAAKPLFLGRAPPADGWGRRRYIYIYINHRITVLPIKNGDFPSFIQLAS